MGGDRGDLRAKKWHVLYIISHVLFCAFFFVQLKPHQFNYVSVKRIA